MHRTDSHRSGFSVLEGLLVILLVAGLGVGGWAVYQRTKQSATSVDAASSPSQPTQQTPAPAGPTVSYLTIIEWGIKIPLSGAIKDAKYIPSATIVDSQGRPAAMWLNTATLEAMGCTLSNKDRDGANAVGELMRIEPGQQDGVTGELLSKEFPNGSTVGGYYYAYKSWAGTNTCASTTEQQALDAAFAGAVNGQIKPSN